MVHNQQVRGMHEVVIHLLVIAERFDLEGCFGETMRMAQ
jgi:hypothetical protein